MKNPAFTGGCIVLALWVALAYAMGLPGDAAGPGMVVSIVVGAACGTGLRRGLLGASSGFWQTTVGRWLIGRIAGAIVYLSLVALLWTPAAFVVNYGVISLVHVIGWQAAAALAPVFPWGVWAGAGVAAWHLRTPAKVLIGKASAPLRRFYRSLRMGAGGSASFAGICEEWSHRWAPGRVFLGYSLFDRHWPVGIRDDRMMTVLGANGSGKDETCIIPMLLQYQNGSAFVIDIKGQDAAVTAEARRRMGQTVHILDPFGSLGQGTAHLNPLDGLEPESDTYVEDIYGIVDALVIETGNENNRFFSESARTVIAGAIDYAVRRKTGEFVPPMGVDVEFELQEEGDE